MAGLAGGLLSDARLQRHLGSLVGFAAGALLGAAFLDLLPEAVAELGRPAFAWAVLGFALAAMLEWRLDHHRHTRAPGVRVMPLALLGSDALHNASDGAAIAAAFLISTRAGLATAAAVVLHELPQEVGDYALLRASGVTRGRALLGLFAVQLTAFVGAAGVLVASEHVGRVAQIAVALAAGTFFYIGATDLLPEVGRGTLEDSRPRKIAFLVGLVGLGALTAWLG